MHAELSRTKSRKALSGHSVGRLFQEQDDTCESRYGRVAELWSGRTQSGVIRRSGHRYHLPRTAKRGDSGTIFLSLFQSDAWTISLPGRFWISFYVSVYLCLSLYLVLSLCLSISVYVFVCLYISVSLCLSHCFSSRAFLELSSSFSLPGQFWNSLSSRAILDLFLSVSVCLSVSIFQLWKWCLEFENPVVCLSDTFRWSPCNPLPFVTWRLSHLLVARSASE